MIAALTGSHLFHAFQGGSLAVIRQRDVINRMNVYPVPDGDTGSNLSSTLKSGVDNAQHHDSFGRTLKSIADNMLMGARGNSGLLFAQFINGLADAVGDKARVGKEAFVEAVSKAVASTYASISTPVEGTILTVMREWSEKLSTEHHVHPDILSLLNNTMDHARESLNKTKEKLAALQKANTIDAGAKGFVEFLTGFVATLTHHAQLQQAGQVPDLAAPELAELSPEHDEADDNHVFDLEGGLDSIPYRYCTECVITGEQLSVDRIRQSLGQFGDSLIVAGSTRTVRLHIHTNQPPAVFDHLTTQGLVSQQKVEDMHLQFLITSRQHGAQRVPIGILTDTTCDIPDELLKQHRIVMVPLSVSFGDQAWLDRYTMDSEGFFRLMAERPEFPTTSQPSPALFRRTYQFLLSHFDHVIANHISAGLSGTTQGSQAEARTVDPERITVVDSRVTSASLGLCLIRLAQELESGCALDSAIKKLGEYQQKTRFAVVVPSLINFVRGGRITPSKARLVKLLNLKPLVNSDLEGKPAIWGKGFGMKGAYRLVFKKMRESLKNGPIHSWAIAHGMAEAEAQRLAKEIEKLVGKPPLFIGTLSPVLATHGGPGAVNIAWLPE